MMKSVLVLVFVFAISALGKLWQFIGRRYPTKQPPALDVAVRQELTALNSELRAMLASMGYDTDPRGTDPESHDGPDSERSSRVAWDAERSSVSAHEIFWEDEPSFGSLAGSPLDDSDYGTRFVTQSLGTTTNPATGFPMISGDMDGVDTGGNLFGSSSFTDSIGSTHSFDSMFSDSFSIH